MGHQQAPPLLAQLASATAPGIAPGSLAARYIAHLEATLAAEQVKAKTLAAELREMRDSEWRRGLQAAETVAMARRHRARAEFLFGLLIEAEAARND